MCRCRPVSVVVLGGVGVEASEQNEGEKRTCEVRSSLVDLACVTAFGAVLPSLTSTSDGASKMSSIADCRWRDA